MADFISYSSANSIVFLDNQDVQEKPLIAGATFFETNGRLYYTIDSSQEQVIKDRLFENYGVDLSRHIDGNIFLRNGTGVTPTVSTVAISEGIDSVTINFNHFFMNNDFTKLMSDLTKEKLQAYLESHNMSYYNFVTSMLKLFDNEEEIIRNIHSIEVTVNRMGITDIRLSVNVGRS